MKSLASTKYILFFQSLTQAQRESFHTFIATHFISKTLPFKIYTFIRLHKNLTSIKDVETLAAAFSPTMNAKSMGNYLSQLYDAAEQWIVQYELESQPQLRDLVMGQWMYKQGLNDQALKIIDNYPQIHNDQHLPSRIIDQMNMLQTLRYHHFADMEDRYEYLHTMVQRNGQIFAAIHQLIKIEVEAIYQIRGLDTHNLIGSITRQVMGIPSSSQNQIFTDLHTLLIEDNVDLFNKHLGAMVKQDHIADGINAHLRYIILHKVSARLYSKNLIDKESLKVILHYGLESGITLNNHKLSTYHFHNIINRLAIIDDQENTLQFIDRWIDKVETKYRKETYKLACMQNYFFHQNFDTLEQMTPIQLFENFDQRLVSNAIQLATNYIYRHKNPRLFELTSDQYSTLIQRNKPKISPTLHKKAYNLGAFLADKRPKTTGLLDEYQPILYHSFCTWLIKNYPA